MKNLPNDITISIIIPAYNCSQYIKKCIDSVRSQTYKNIEIIIIDDGSTDDTSNICDAYAFQDQRIKVIHQTNRGLSAARNAGLECATGDYVTFVDADDYIDHDTIDNYIQYVLKHPKSIYVSGFRKIHNEDWIQHIYCCKYDVLQQSDALSILFDEDGDNFKNYVCNKLYPRSLFDIIRFPEGKIYEDVYVQYKLFGCVDSIVLCPFIGYNYVRHEGSLSNSKKYLLDFVDAQIERFKCVEKTHPEYLHQLARTIFSSYLNRVKHYKIPLFGARNEFHRRIDTEKKIKSISVSLREHLPAYKFKTLMLSLHDNFFSDAIVTMICFLNSILHDLHLTQFLYKLLNYSFFKKRNIQVRECKSMHTSRYTENIYTKIYVRGVDKKKNHVLLQSYSISGTSNIEKSCPNLRILFSKRIEHNKESLIKYEHYEWIDCSTSDSSLISIYGIAFQLGKKIYRNAIPLKDIFHFFSNKLDWLPCFRTTRTWILMDRDTQADDNAEHLYRWMRQNHPEQKIFFAIRRTSHDWHRLECDGFNLLNISSIAYLWQRICASTVISSHADSYIYSPASYAHRSIIYTLLPHIYNNIYKFIKRDCMHVFLQHGVTKDNLAEWLNASPISLLITETPAEYAAISGDKYGFRYTTNDVAFTGFPRHDALVPYIDIKPTRPQITFMPTWRRYLLGRDLHSNVRPLDPNFIHSTYARTWQHLLAGEALLRMQEKYDFDVLFFPHANMQPYLPQFTLPAHVRVASHADTCIQDVFRSTSLLVTDYSSVAFEVAFLNRPVIYYQFDAEKFFSGDHIFTKGYFDYDNDGFGPVVCDEDKLLHEIERIASSNYMPQNIYLSRMNKTFKFRDGNNCSRVYNAICSRLQQYMIER